MLFPLLQFGWLYKSVYKLVCMKMQSSGVVSKGLCSNTRIRRWTFYTLLLWAATMLVSIYLFVPETHHPALVDYLAICLNMPNISFPEF